MNEDKMKEEAFELEVLLQVIRIAFPLMVLDELVELGIWVLA